MQVLRIITRLNIGGPARQALLLTHELERRGYTCHLVSGTEREREGSFSPPEGMSHSHLPFLHRELDPRSDLRTLRALTALMRRLKPTIVHTHLAKAGALGRLAARRAGVPIVVHTFHGHVLEGYFSKPVEVAFTAMERRLARSTDALIAVSPAVADSLAQLRIGRPDQWRVLPLGFDLQPLLSSSLGRDEARRRLALPTDRRLVGIVGRLVAIKDHRTFLGAAARLARSRPDVLFVVAGDGDLRNELELAARELLGDRIRFLGWVTDLPALYAALDVIVLTSRNEGTPVALIEAGAAGRPSVSTHVGGVSDVVRHGETGLLAEAGDEAGVAAATGRILGDVGLAADLGRSARAWVEDRFSSERLVSDICSLYEELLARDRSDPPAGAPRP